MEINKEQFHTLWNFVEDKVFIEHWVFPCLDLCLISLFLGWEEEYSDLGTAGPAPLFTGDVLGLMNRDGHLPFGRVVLKRHLQTATFWYQRWLLSVHVTDVKQVLLENKSKGTLYDNDWCFITSLFHLYLIYLNTSTNILLVPAAKKFNGKWNSK